MFNKKLKKIGSTPPEPKVFISNLLFLLGADYLSLRTLFCTNHVLFTHQIILKSIDIAEKSLKILSSHNNQILPDTNHNIEEFRKNASLYNAIFNDGDIKNFTKSLDDNGGQVYQLVKYGHQKYIDGYGGFSPLNLIQVIDKIIFTMLDSLQPEFDEYILSNRFLVTRVLNNQSGKNNDLIKTALEKDNQYVGGFKDKLEVTNCDFKL